MGSFWVKFPFKQMDSFPIKQVVHRVKRWIPSVKSAHFRKLLSRRPPAPNSWENVLRRMDRLNTAELIYLAAFHEIKNPLCIMKTLLQVLPEHFNDPQQCQKVLTMALAEALTIEEELQRCLCQEPTERPPLESLSLEKIIRDAGESLAVKFKSLRIQFALEAPIDLINIQGKETLLRSVFVNLLINSFEAMPYGGEIRVLITATPSSLEVKFTDSGSGVAPFRRKKIFDAFHTTKPHGSGLGLFVVRSILKEHAATIQLKESSPRGTEFHLHFPLDPHHKSRPTPASREESQLRADE